MGRNPKTKVYPQSASLTLICALLILFAGFAQAIHVHPDNSTSPNHECSVCSVAHAGALLRTAYQPIPILTRSALVRCQEASPHSLLLTSFLYIRPPPSV
jgi:hypothetical protein